LERGTCHTLWHRLDLDFVFDYPNTGRVSAYTCVNACRFILERWAEPADLLVAKVVPGAQAARHHEVATT